MFTELGPLSFFSLNLLHNTVLQGVFQVPNPSIQSICAHNLTKCSYHKNCIINIANAYWQTGHYEAEVLCFWYFQCRESQLAPFFYSCLEPGLAFSPFSPTSGFITAFLQSTRHFSKSLLVL